MKFKCIWFTCSKRYSKKPTPKDIIIHLVDSHPSSLVFLVQKELERYIKVDEPSLKVEEE